MTNDIAIRPSVAAALGGLNRAIIIEHVILNCKGFEWMRATHADWVESMPWLGESTIRKQIAQLRKDGWLETAHLSNSHDRTLHYAANQIKVSEACLKFKHVDALWQRP